MATTADSLITRVVRACGWPSTEANRPRTNAEILQIADEVLLGVVWPAVLALSPDYYVCALDHTMQSTYSRYRLPAKSFGPIRDVVLVDDDGAESDVPLVDLEDLGHAARLIGTLHHFIDGDFVGLYPTPDSSMDGDTLRIRYFRAPSTLALAATATTITAVDLESDPDTITVDDGALFAEGDELDIISAGNAHAVLAEDVGIATLATNDVSFDRSLLGSGIQVGDHVAPAGTSPIVQAPDHAIPWLVSLVAADAMRHQDPAGAQVAEELARRAHDRMVQIAAPRTVSAPMTLGDRFSPFERYR